MRHCAGILHLLDFGNYEEEHYKLKCISSFVISHFEMQEQ